MRNQPVGIASFVIIAMLSSTAFSAEPQRQTSSQPTGMVTRAFDVLPTFLEKVRAGSGEVEGGEGADGARVAHPEEEREEVKAFFEGLGVSWPEGSSIKFVPSLNKLIVKNTPENVAVFESIMSVRGDVPNQIEIEVQIVEFNMTDIDTLARNGIIDAEALKRLREAGKAKLLYAPKIITQSGQEATVKGCTEVIYPATFSIYGSSVTNTNDTVDAVLPVAEPRRFQTREVGIRLTVLPEVAADGSMINLTLTAVIAYDPIWRNYASRLTSANGTQRVFNMQEPFFFSQTILQSFSLLNGSTTLSGGGLPCSDKEKVAYVFVTVQQVDNEGRDVVSRVAREFDPGERR